MHFKQILFTRLCNVHAGAYQWVPLLHENWLLLSHDQVFQVERSAEVHPIVLTTDH